MRTEKEIRQELKDLFENDNTLFNETIEKLDSYNDYGNLVSSDDKDYSNYLDDYFIDDLLENRSYLSLDTDVEALLDELENA